MKYYLLIDNDWFLYHFPTMYMNWRCSIVSEVNNRMVSEMIELAWLKSEPTTKRSLTSDHPARWYRHSKQSGHPILWTADWPLPGTQDTSTAFILFKIEKMIDPVNQIHLPVGLTILTRLGFWKKHFSIQTTLRNADIEEIILCVLMRIAVLLRD